MSETNKVEAILNEIKESLEVENKVSETIAKNADELVAAQVERFETLNKGILAMVEKLDAIVAKIDTLNDHTDELVNKAVQEKTEEINKTVEEKSEKIEELSKKVEVLENEPVVKSATVVVAEEVVEEAAPEVVAPTRSELIEKCMAELNTASNDRKAILFKAITRLEAGVDIDKVNF